MGTTLLSRELLRGDLKQNLALKTGLNNCVNDLCGLIKVDVPLCWLSMASGRGEEKVVGIQNSVSMLLVDHYGHTCWMECILNCQLFEEKLNLYQNVLLFPEGKLKEQSQLREEWRTCLSDIKIDLLRTTLPWAAHQASTISLLSEPDLVADVCCLNFLPLFALQAHQKKPWSLTSREGYVCPQRQKGKVAWVCFACSWNDLICKWIQDVISKDTVLLVVWWCRTMLLLKYLQY